MPSLQIVTGWEDFLKNPPLTISGPDIQAQSECHKALKKADSNLVADDKKAIYFYHQDQPNGQFANSYPAKITLTAEEVKNLSGESSQFPETSPISFSSAEHAFQYLRIRSIALNNSRLDTKHAASSPASTSSNNQDLIAELNKLKTAGPTDLSAIVATIDAKLPKDEKLALAKPEELLTTILTKKFLQNPDLAASLVETEDKLLVHANPYDQQLGFGLVDAKASSVTQGKNLLGSALENVRKNPDIQNLAKNSKAIKEMDSKLTPLITKVKSTITAAGLTAERFKDVAGKGANTDAFLPEKRDFATEALAKEIDQIESTLLSSNPSKQVAIMKQFATFRSHLETQHYRLMCNQGFDVKEINEQLTILEGSLLNTQSIDVKQATKAIREQHLENYLKNMNERIEAARFTAASQAVFLETKYSRWTKKGDPTPPKKPGEATVEGAIESYEKPLEAGEYTSGNSDIILTLSDDKKGNYSIAWNILDKPDPISVKEHIIALLWKAPGKTDPEVIKKGMSEAIALLMANGSTEVNLNYENFNKESIKYYLQGIELFLKAAQSKDALIHLNKELVGKLYANIKDPSSDLEKLKALEGKIAYHNTGVNNKRSEQKDNADKSSKNAFPEKALKEANKKRLQDIQEVLEHRSQPDADSAKQLEKDNVKITFLQKALAEIKKQLVSLDQKFDPKELDPRNAEILQQASKIQNLSKAFVQTLLDLEKRFDDAKDPSLVTSSKNNLLQLGKDYEDFLAIAKKDLQLAQKKPEAMPIDIASLAPSAPPAPVVSPGGGKPAATPTP